MKNLIKRKMSVVAVAAVSAMLLAMAVAASAASATEWRNSKGQITSNVAITSGTSIAGEMEAKSILGTTIVKCESDENGGHLEPPNKVGGVTVTYHGCTGEKGGEVYSPGNAGKGIIATHELTGELVTTTSGSGLGLKLLPASGTVFVKLEGAVPLKSDEVTGYVIGEVNPVGALAPCGTLNFFKSNKTLEVFTGTAGLQDEATECFAEEIEAV